MVPDADRSYELAIFVRLEYQGVGIGSVMLPVLLRTGAGRGVEEVLLTVERHNRRAVALYEDFGFDVAEANGHELVMSLAFDRAGDGDR